MPTTDISETLLSEIATLLQVERVAPDDVPSRLLDYQRANHPDRFQDLAAQRVAEERFKNAGALLEQWRTFIERAATGLSPETAIERVGPQDVALARSQLEVGTLLQDLYKSQQDLKYAQSEIDGLTRENEALKKELASRLDAGIARAREEIVVPYRPTRKTVTVLSITAAMTALSVVLGQVDALTTKTLAPLGLASHYASAILFGALFCVTIVATYRYVKASYLSYLLGELCTTGSLRRFASTAQKRHPAEDDTIEFTESDALDFVHIDLRMGRGIHRVAALCKLRTFSESTVDLLKDLLIAHMINLGLIDAGPPHNLERAFRIRKKPNYVSWSQIASFPASMKPKENADAS